MSLSADGCVQTLVLIVDPGTLSLNVHIPHNQLPDEDEPSGGYEIFGIAIVLVVVVGVLSVALIRWIWKSGSRRRK